jgi:hypothetical protein
VAELFIIYEFKKIHVLVGKPEGMRSFRRLGEDVKIVILGK